MTSGGVATQFGVRQSYLILLQVKLTAQAVEMDSFRVDVLKHEIAVEQGRGTSAAAAKIAGQQAAHRIVETQNLLQIVGGRVVEAGFQ